MRIISLNTWREYVKALALLMIIAAATVLIVMRSHDEIKSCMKGDFLEHYKCWDQVMRSDIAEDKLTLALQQLDAFSKESPDFVSTCHSFAHDVGGRAYSDFKTGKHITPSAEMQICDFGFYHGFMTAFLSESHDFKEVGAFCASMQEKATNGLQTDSRDACFHGIGHGSVIDHDPADWNDPLTIVNQAIRTCRASAQDQNDFLKCVGGAYNGLAYGPYQTHLDPQDPFKICRQITLDDSPVDCYANLASVAFNLTPDKTIREAVDLASTFTPAEYLPRVIPTFANMAARQKGSEAASAATCLSLSGDQRQFCISGYVTGLIQAQPIETKQEAAYEFCSGDLLPKRIHADCFAYAFETLSGFWTTQKIEDSCSRAADIVACRSALVSWRSTQTGPAQ